MSIDQESSTLLNLVNEFRMIDFRIALVFNRSCYFKVHFSALSPQPCPQTRGYASSMPFLDSEHYMDKVTIVGNLISTFLVSYILVMKYFGSASKKFRFTTSRFRQKFSILAVPSSSSVDCRPGIRSLRLLYPEN